MATITIRGLPEPLIERIKDQARYHGRSMEQELRELLLHYYRPKAEVLTRIQARWDKLPSVLSKDVEQWLEIGRK